MFFDYLVKLLPVDNIQRFVDFYLDVCWWFSEVSTDYIAQGNTGGEGADEFLANLTVGPC
jgi:hypothetical protein